MDPDPGVKIAPNLEKIENFSSLEKKNLKIKKFSDFEFFLQNKNTTVHCQQFKIV
jgi:hypothetical protein